MSKTEEKIKKSQIANWLIDVLGQTDITNNSLNELIDNEYDNYVMKQDYEKRIAELEREVKMWRDGEFVSQRVAKKSIELMEGFEKTIRHEICEKIRQEVDKLYLLVYDKFNHIKLSEVEQILNKIEGGE